ncbi:hypothetical protein LTR94_025013, partial [Friedmanniomyces endolithicus]
MDPSSSQTAAQATLSDRLRAEPLLGYGLAVMAWAAAFAVRHLLGPWFPPGFPYLTFFPAVVIVAYFAGLRPALATALVSGLTAWWFWIGEPGFDWSLATLVALGFYGFVVAVDIFFIVGMDTARRRLRAEVARSDALAKSRDILLQEVQHRVSNNIQVVSALLSIEARGVSDPAARRALKSAQARTETIARIQRNLTTLDNERTDFATLAQTIAGSALSASGRTDVVLRIDPTPLGLSSQEAVPVMLILLEAVNNALEHGLAGAGVIDIQLTETGDERRLEVRDNGQGLGAEWDPLKADSLGLRLVSGLAQQLSGRFALRPLSQGA